MPAFKFHSVSVVIALGKRPVTFRTRKLSLSAPMVLQGGPCGRVGRRRTIFQGPLVPAFTLGPGVLLFLSKRVGRSAARECLWYPKTGVTPMSTNSPDDRPE